MSRICFQSSADDGLHSLDALHAGHQDARSLSILRETLLAISVLVACVLNRHKQLLLVECLATHELTYLRKELAHSL